MSGLVRKYFTSMVVVLSMLLGFLLPQAGLVWKPYLSVLLMFLMFFVALDMELSEVAQAMRSYRVIAVGLFTAFVLLPVLAFSTKPFLSPIFYAGIVLAFCCPSAIVSAFWTRVFKGDVCTALVMSIITNLLSIVTIPGTMLIAIGTAVSVDITSMIISLVEIILVPMSAAFLVRASVRLDWNRTGGYRSAAELGILALLIWGSIAPGVEYVRNGLVEFAVLNVLILGLLALAFTLTHFLAERFGHERAVSIEIATVVKNAALSLVVGLTAFSPQVLPPLVANLIAQNLLLIVAKALRKE